MHENKTRLAPPAPAATPPPRDRQRPLATYRHGTDDEAGRVGAVYTNASESCWQNAEWYGPVPVFKRDPIGSAMIPRRVSLHLSRKNKHACKLSLLLTLQEKSEVVLPEFMKPRVRCKGVGDCRRRPKPFG